MVSFGFYIIMKKNARKKEAMLGVSPRSSQILSPSLAGLNRLPCLGHPQSITWNVLN